MAQPSQMTFELLTLVRPFTSEDAKKINTANRLQRVCCQRSPSHIDLTKLNATLWISKKLLLPRCMVLKTFFVYISDSNKLFDSIHILYIHKTPSKLPVAWDCCLHILFWTQADRNIYILCIWIHKIVVHWSTPKQTGGTERISDTFRQQESFRLWYTLGTLRV